MERDTSDRNMSEAPDAFVTDMINLLWHSQHRRIPKSPPTIPRAVAYARVSTSMQAARLASIAEQLRQIRSYAARRGIEIAHEFQEATSAFQEEHKRVEFHRMLATVKEDKSLKLILVHDFTRFCRDSLRGFELVRELRSAGVEVVSLNDPDLDPTTASGIYAEAITFASAEASSREKGFHTSKGLRANLQTRDSETGWCYKNGANPPWGYRAIHLQRGESRPNHPIMKRMWALDDTVVNGRPVYEWVRYCLMELAARGETPKEIAEFCTKAGLPSPHGTWRRDSWCKRLTPRRLLQYAGYAIVGTHGRNAGRRTHANHGALVPNAHPGIITPAEANAIVAFRKEFSDKSFVNSSMHLLLSGGFMRCPTCGQPMWGWARRSRSGRPCPVYKCVGQSRGHVGESCRGARYIHAEPADAQVIAGLVRLIRRLQKSEGALQRINRQLWAEWERGLSPGRRAARMDDSVVPARGESSVARDGMGRVTRQPVPSPSPAAPVEAVTSRNSEDDDRGVIGGPMQIDADACAEFTRYAGEILSKGSPKQRKLLLRAWLERVELSEDRRRARAIFRLPPQIVQRPTGTSWCGGDSRSLVRMFTHEFELR